MVPSSSTEGPGLLAFLRYEASNVGPYDELLWLSLNGAYSVGAWQPSVTKIYVSTDASRISGRANWGIPKERADFSLTRLAPQAVRVRVTVEHATIAAFKLTTSRISVPVNLALLPRPMRTLVQTFQGNVYRFAPVARGRLHRAWFSECSVDPERFPAAATGRRIGAVSLQNLRLEFPAAKVTRKP